MIISATKDKDLAYGFEPKNIESISDIVEYATNKSINWSCGTYVDNHRSIKNFISADFIGLDIDNDGKEGCVMSLVDAKEIFKDYSHIIVTSQNHQKEKKGLVSDRFRVVISLSRAITNKDEYYATWAWAKNKWPATDTKCKDPSRYWNGGGELVQSNESGLKIDPITAMPKEKKPPIIEEGGVKGKPSALTVNFIINGATKNSRHDTLWRATKDLKEQGYSENKIIEVLTPPAMASYGDEKDECEIGEDITRFYQEEVRHNKRSHFNFMRLSEIEETPVDWVVDGLIASGTTNVFAGKGGLGKSTLVRQLCKCVCDGIPFLGKRTQKSAVLYIAAEENKSIVVKQTTIQNLHECTNFHIHIGEVAPLENIEELTLIVGELSIKLLVIDSLSDAIESAELNDGSAISRQLSRWRNFTSETGCSVLFIHHVRKSQGTKGKYHDASSVNSDDVTGSHFIRDKVDMVMVFSGDTENMQRYISTTKIREGDPIQKLPLFYDTKKFWYGIKRGY